MSDIKTNRQRFFDTSIHHPKVKDCISGKNEDRVLNVLKGMDYVLDVDFVRQYPIGDRFVVDIAFVKEKVAIEVDGIGHEEKRQSKIDKKRDRFFYDNNWVVIRVPDKDFFGSKGSFYKSLIREVVEERRKQYEGGFLGQKDKEIQPYNDNDY